MFTRVTVALLLSCFLSFSEGLFSPKVDTCGEFTFANCIPPEVSQAIGAADVKVCKQYCATFGAVCDFYLFDEELKTCFIYDQMTLLQYVQTCKFVGGPDKIKFVDCDFNRVSSVKLEVFNQMTH
jgi:hypothetical protein